MSTKDIQKGIAKYVPHLLGETDSSKIILGLLKEIQAAHDDYKSLENRKLAGLPGEARQDPEKDPSKRKESTARTKKGKGNKV